MKVGLCAWLFSRPCIAGLLANASPWFGLDTHQIALFSHTKKEPIRTSDCRSYKPLSKSVIELDHTAEPSRPFTQGLAIRLNSTCTGVLGKRLEKCLGSSREESLRECYVKEFLKCNLVLYESSGLFGQSYLRKVSFSPAATKYALDLESQDFAEGIDYIPVQDKILLGTWKSNKLLVVEDTGKAFRVEKVYKTRIGQHWGIASDGKSVWVTTGNPKAFVFDIEDIVAGNDGNTVKPIREVTMRDCQGNPLHFVNEMTYDFDRGTIWGNIWGSDVAKQFDPRNGKCRGDLMLNHLNSREPALGSTAKTKSAKVPEALWNGIVYLGDDWFLVTGKFFLKIFVFKIVEST